MRVRVLQTIGEAMYGDQWRTAVASDLGVSYRTVARWLAADDMPDDVPARLRPLMTRRLRAMRAARLLLWSGRKAVP